MLKINKLLLGVSLLSINLLLTIPRRPGAYAAVHSQKPHYHTIQKIFYGIQAINALIILGILSEDHKRILFPHWFLLTGSLCSLIDSIGHLIHLHYYDH